MKVFVCCLLLMQFAYSLAQVPTKVDFDEYERKFIMQPNGEPDLSGCDFIIYCANREAALEILSKFHKSERLEYEVVWGKIDAIRVWKRQPDKDEDVHFELLLRYALNELSMTYRIDGGVVQLVHRGLPAYPSEYSFDPPRVEIKGNAVNVLENRANSLDYLAAVLSQRGIGYHVNGVQGQEIMFQAVLRPLKYVLDQIDALDAGLQIDWINGVSVIRQS